MARYVKPRQLATSSSAPLLIRVFTWVLKCGGFVTICDVHQNKALTWTMPHGSFALVASRVQSDNQESISSDPLYLSLKRAASIITTTEQLSTG